MVIFPVGCNDAARQREDSVEWPKSCKQTLPDGNSGQEEEKDVSFDGLFGALTPLPPPAAAAAAAAIDLTFYGEPNAAAI